MPSALSVDSPTRKPARGGLLPVANVIDSNDPHILQGITYVPDGCDIPLISRGSCWVTNAPTPPANQTFEGIDNPITTPLSFVLHAAVRCFMGPDEDFMERARRVLNEGESVAVEKVVLSQLLAPTASLATETSFVNALGRAEQWLGWNYPALGLIHLDRRNASINQGSFEIDSNYIYTTKQGVPVANGSGYGTSTGAGSDPYTFFATGQVNIWRSPIIEVGTREVEKNSLIAMVERHYAVSIDCGLIAKITVDVP